MQEAKWQKENHVPTCDEFMDSAFKSSAINVVVILSLLDNEIEESTKNKRSDIISTYGKLQRVAFIIGRFMNDIADCEASYNFVMTS